MEKICIKCKIEKPLSNFKNKRGECNDCIKMLQKEYYQKNKVERIIKAQDYYKNNTDKIKTKSKERYIEKRQIYKQKSKEYYSKNRDCIVKKVSEYRNANRDIINKKRRDKQYYKSPVAKIKSSLYNRLNKIIKYKELRVYKKQISFLGCTAKELKFHLESKFLPTMTWENYGKLWHIDHIIPCAHFDLTKEEDQKKCFHYTNLQPLFAVTTTVDGVTYIGNLNKKSKII